MSNDEFIGHHAQKPILTNEPRELTVQEVYWFLANDPDALTFPRQALAEGVDW